MSLIRQHLSLELKPIATLSLLSGELIEQKVINPNDIEDISAYLRLIVLNEPHVVWVYWSNIAGDHIQMQKVGQNLLRDEIRHTENGIIKKTDVLDPNGKIIEPLSQEISDYDPRTRPWYILAKEQKKTIWSKIYTFYPFSSQSTELGVTSASPVYERGRLQGVFGIDVSLKTITEFLNSKTIGLSGFACILNQEGKIIAFPESLKRNQAKETSRIQKHYDTLIHEIFDKHKETKSENVALTINNVEYIGSFERVPQLKDNEILITALVPKKELIGAFSRQTKTILVTSGSILLIIIIFILLISQKIQEQMKTLINKTTEIMSFHLEKVGTVSQFIKEFSVIDHSIELMRTSLVAFGKYIPQDVVRELVKKGQTAQLGVQVKELTIFFSDIKGFSKISENMEPNELVNHLKYYFTKMIQTIDSEKGTVDKLIGDSIMAFWGAPTENPNHCENACKGALKCLEFLSHQNPEWEKAKQPPFETLFGLDKGEVLVGNIGSESRMNYTIIGKLVNTASRLQMLNKFYHTHIIVSERVYETCKDKFIFRYLDHVTAAGMESSVKVYELINTSDKKPSYDLPKYEKIFQTAHNFYQKGQWDDSCKHFEELKKTFPEDCLVQIYLDRIQVLKNRKEPWKGVWTHTSK